MRRLPSFVAVILMLFGLVLPLDVSSIPAQAAAQEVPGHILFTVRICSAPRSEAGWVGTFSDSSDCEGFVSGDGSTPMVITLDGGQFLDGDVPNGSTLTLPFASMLDANLYLTAGDYTLTITFQPPFSDSDLVTTSTSVHIVADQTLPLTFTALYALQFGAEPTTVPVEATEVPVDQLEGPVATTEVPLESAATEAAEGSNTEASAASSGNVTHTATTTLPRTGTGPASTRRSFVLVSTLLAAFATIAGAVTIRMRRR